MEQNNEKKFYDIHFHAFDLSHPNLSAFIKRYIREYGFTFLLVSVVVVVLTNWLLERYGDLMAYFLVGFIALILLVTVLHLTCPSKFSGALFSLFARIFKRHLNLLALMENDLGNYFLLTENVLRKTFPNGKIFINNSEYRKIVITPLMMDFGSKNILSKLLPYGNTPVRKPIAQQVTDVFNGIRTYVRKRPKGMLEIYPFLGLSPQCYDLQELKDLLDKYFGKYQRTESALYENMGKFTGDINQLGSNYFAGIKVYPPLGFDPWPEDGEDWEEERIKVEHLYGFCCEKNIPLTTHCNDGGFIVDSIFVSHKRTSPEKWEKVLAHYPKLKLNLAHMGDEESIFSWSRFRLAKRSWTDIVFKLIAEYDNVYTDFSCLAFKNKSYKKLKRQLEEKTEELKDKLRTKPYKLKDKILFGSDFMINLQWIDTYNEYLSLFAKTEHFQGQEKGLFCSTNPKKFLFE